MFEFFGLPRPGLPVLRTGKRMIRLYLIS